jgi:hypothetical protein
MRKLIVLMALVAFGLSLPANAAGHKKHRRYKSHKHYTEHVHHTQPFGTYPGS